MLNLQTLSDAIQNRIKAALPDLKYVITLNAEEELDDDKTPAPAIYTLIRGGNLSAPEGMSDYQSGTLEIMVWIKTRHVGKQRGQAGEALYPLFDQVLAALSHWQPTGCCALYCSDFGIYRLSDRFSKVMALQFSLPIETGD
jgi:hypothetical protein